MPDRAGRKTALQARPEASRAVGGSTMKLILNYRTALGPRTIIAEVADLSTAHAVRSAHQALGEDASLVEEMPRLSMAEHLAKHKKRNVRAKIKLIEAFPNVTTLKRRK